jgi:DNA-binding transcriptional ArsR family regulator
LRQLLWYLIAGTRGGVNRARIIVALRGRPFNAHQLCEVLQLDYRTVRHHLDLLLRNGLLTRPAGDAYAAPYFLSPILEANYGVFEEVCGNVPQAPAKPRERGGSGRDHLREEE